MAETSGQPPEHRPPLGIEWHIAGIGAVVGAVAGALAAWLDSSAWPTAVAGVGLGAAVGAVIAFLLARPVKRDVREIAVYAALLARGQWEARLPERGTGELRYLMRQLEAMAAALKEQLGALRRLADERARLADRAERLAILEERQRLARELHDTVSQELFAVAMLVGAARQSLSPDAGDVAEKLVRAEAGAQRAQASMRGLIRALRPVELGDQDLVSALRAVVEEVSARQGIEATLDATDVVAAIPLAVEDALFRIAQEAVANAARHANPQHIRLTVRYDGGGGQLVVADDGRGFDVDATRPHIGLASMAERAAEIGAQLKVSSEPTRGTTVEVRWKVEPDDGP